MKNKKWATHALNTLVGSIVSFKKSNAKKQNRLGGCVLFLQLFYMSKAGMTPPKDVKLLEYVKKNTIYKFLKKHGTVSEKEDVKLSQRGVEHVEKKPKKQKVIDEEVILNSLNLKYNEFEEQWKFYENLYPENEICKDIKKKMQIIYDGTKQESITKSQNEETILVGPFHVRTSKAPTVEDKILLEWIFKRQDKEEEEAEVASVVSGVFPAKKIAFMYLLPEAWMSSFIINLVVEMLCVKELRKLDPERWYFVVELLQEDPEDIRTDRVYHVNDSMKLKSVNQFFFPIGHYNYFFLIMVNTQEKVVEV